MGTMNDARLVIFLGFLGIGIGSALIGLIFFALGSLPTNGFEKIFLIEMVCAVPVLGSFIWEQWSRRGEKE